MAYFPTSPTNGQTVTVNGILYTYNTAKGAWKRVISTFGNLDVSGNITAANITISSNAAANKFYVTDGIYWAGNGTAFASTTYSNANVASYLLDGATIGAGSTTANLVAAATTPSTDTTTGALVVRGGAGVAGALFITNTGDVSANIGSLLTNAATQQTQINSIITNANANVAAYLPTYTGNIGAGNIITSGTSGNITGVSYISASNYVYPNGVSILTGIGGTYSNANAAAYLVTATGNIAAGNVIVSSNISGGRFFTSSGIYWSGNGAAYAAGGGGSFTASATAPVSPGLGSFWYKTTTDVLYEYINDGTTSYWVDIQTQTIAANTAGVSTFAGTVFGANITFTGSITGTVGYLIERANVVASAPPAVTNLDLITAPILYFTSNTTQNITANIRGNSTTTLNSLLAIGQSTTFVIFVPNATAYYINTVKVDNTTVTPYWQGGITVSAGNANSIDIYTFAVLKTANATFKVFASQVKYQNLGP